MRVADVQLSFRILIALLVDGLARTLLPREHHEVALYVLVFAIGISGWVQYAGQSEADVSRKRKEYVQAARVIGIRKWTILLRHIRM